MRFGTDTYRNGALVRINDARILREKDQLSGSMYMAGLAVEGMLRSLIRLTDRAFDERHDLRRMAVKVEHLGLFRRADRDHDFVAGIQAIARSWVNELRFSDDRQVERWLRSIDVLKRTGKGAFRKTADDHLARCRKFIKRCELLWQRRQK